MSDEYQHRLTLWAARTLGVPPEKIATVSTDTVGGCGFNTCEYTIAEIHVTLTDGRTFEGENSFGDFLDCILNESLNPDGTMNSGWYRGRNHPLFELKEATSDD